MALTVAAIQMAMVDDVDDNVATAERLVREAAAEGAQIVLIPELFEGPYFCMDMLPEHFDRARPVDGHPTVEHFRSRRRRARRRAAAQHLRAGQPRHVQHASSSSTPTARVLGTYRKSHIPDGPGYTEKYYFNPGDTGFRVWRDAARRRRRRHLLGPVVPRVGPLHGAARRRACCATRRRSAASRPTRSGTRAATGSG